MIKSLHPPSSVPNDALSKVGTQNVKHGLRPTRLEFKLEISIET